MQDGGKRSIPRVALALAACFALAGCTIQHFAWAVPDDFYGAAPSPSVGTHPRVAIYAPPATVGLPLDIRGLIPVAWYAHATIFPAVERALQTALQPSFDATVISDPVQASGYDLLVTVVASVQTIPEDCLSFDANKKPVYTPGCKASGYAVGIVVSDPHSGFALLESTKLRWVNATDKYDPYYLDVGSNREAVVLAAFEKQLRILVDALASAITSDPRLPTYTANTSKARSLAAACAAAQQTGRVQEAFDACLQALPFAWPGSPEDRQCRAQAMILAPKLPQPPAVSEDARRHMDRGKLLVSHATSAADYDSAAVEMVAAAQAAPWWGTAYFNLGLVQASAGHFSPAIFNLNLYLAGNPGASDADAVRKKIDELELKAEGKIAP